MRRLITVIAGMLVCLSCFAQADRHDVRSGNRKFRRDKFKEAEIDYRKAVLKDSLSVAAEYNLASDLYRQEDWEGADKALQAIKDVAPQGASAADYWYNLGDVALQKKDYSSAVEDFKQALLLRPGDLDAKENYIYARMMLQNQQNGGQGGQDQDQQNQQDQQDQQDRQNQDENQDQQDRNQDQQNQDQQDQSGPQPSDQQISQQQAQQMLKAIQAKEKETQDKVNKEKAALLQSRQKDKNW